MAMKLLMFVMILCFAFGEVTISQKASRGISAEPVIFEVLVNTPCETYLAQALSSIQISRVQSNPTCLPIAPLDPANDVNDYHAHVFCTNIDGGRRSLFRFHEIFVVNEDETPAPGAQFIVSWTVNRRFRENTAKFTYRRRPSCTIGNDVCSPTQIVNDCWDNAVDLDDGFVDSNDRIYFIPPGVTVATCTLNGACCPYISLTNLGLCGGSAPNLCQGVNCDDGNACTVDSCNPSTGVCSNVPKSCSDGFFCTTDSCDPSTGVCSHTPITCDDGLLCTTDSCVEGASAYTCSNVARVCADGNPCTTDSCDPATGLCQFVTKTCAPTNFCDGDNNGVCDPSTGDCIFNTPRDCNDNNVCTLGDFCNRTLQNCSSTGFQYCGVGSDACKYKVCDATLGCMELPLSCFDADTCTRDSCDIITGLCLNTFFCGTSASCFTGTCTRQDCVQGNKSIPCPTDNGLQVPADFCTYTDTCPPGRVCNTFLRCCADGPAITARCI